MGRYSEVKIFRPRMEATRRDLFVSTHERFAVDLFDIGKPVETNAVNAKRSAHLHFIS
jgi:hypothetical protein